MNGEQRRLTELTREESLCLLATVPVGRVIFTERALPAVRPVNHLVDGGAVIFRTHEGAAVVRVAGHTDGAVVAFEADEIDLDSLEGWSVVVTGLARLVADEVEAARYRRLVQPWSDGEMEYVIRISVELVTGFRIGGAAGGSAGT
jgi:nitroimidazol reductase NimA-like FMN-containing flavoprotein (pyridoxamine 5'-phosphate oxidase superfamily)